jgi:hypothetical protein
MESRACRADGARAVLFIAYYAFSMPAMPVGLLLTIYGHGATRTIGLALLVVAVLLMAFQSDRCLAEGSGGADVGVRLGRTPRSECLCLICERVRWRCAIRTLDAVPQLACIAPICGRRGKDSEGYSALLADHGIAWLSSAVAAALPYGHVR